MADGNLIRKCVQRKFGVAVFMVRGISKNPENPTYIDLMLTNSSDSFQNTCFSETFVRNLSKKTEKRLLWNLSRSNQFDQINLTHFLNQKL